MWVLPRLPCTTVLYLCFTPTCQVPVPFLHPRVYPFIHPPSVYLSQQTVPSIFQSLSQDCEHVVMCHYLCLECCFHQWARLISLSPDPNRLYILLGRVCLWFLLTLWFPAPRPMPGTHKHSWNNLSKLTEMSQYVTVTQDETLREQNWGDFQMEREMVQC